MSRLRRLGHVAEAVGAHLLWGLLRALPLDVASGLGGGLCRALGPRLKASRVARANIALAMPELSATAREAVLRESWDMFGRTVAEFPHLARIPEDRIELVGADVLASLRARTGPALLFGAHFGNWEIPAVVGHRTGVRYHGIYRAANNPLVDRLYRAARLPLMAGLIPKGAAGARAALAALRDGGAVALLVDQKMNDGIAVPFFGRPAMTAPALSQLALRFHCPVVPVRVDRLGGARFRLTLFPPLNVAGLTAGLDRRGAETAIMAHINAILEDWIRAAPGQWLWLHRRWPREEYPP